MADAGRRAKRKKTSWGGARIGSGRPGLFRGTRVKMTVKLTELAKAKVDETVIALEPEHGALATGSAAVEWLIRTAGRIPFDA